MQLDIWILLGTIGTSQSVVIIMSIWTQTSLFMKITSLSVLA